MHGAATTEVLTQALVFLGATAVVIPLVRRLGLSSVMGFLLIGVAIGPQVLGQLSRSWPWLADWALDPGEPTQFLGEMGVVFLLFIIGLEVSFERLWALRRLVFGLGVAQVVLTATVVGALTFALGASFPVAVVLGLAFAMSSTALVLQLMREQRSMSTAAGRAAFSVLLTQDLMVVPILFLVAALSPQSAVFGPNQIAIALITAVVSIALILGAGRLVLRPLFNWVAAAGGRDVFMAAALLAAIGMAAAAEEAGFSMALGALAAGLLLAETEFRLQIETDLEPFKDLLLGLFFVTVGMQIDIALLLREPAAIVSGVVLLIAIKAGIVAPLARLFGLSWRRAIETAFLLGQVGEFAFVIIAAARAGGVVPEGIAAYMLMITALSIFVTPFVAQLGGRLAERIEPSSQAPPLEAERESGHVVIAGFGRVGRTLADMLAAQEIGYAAIDADAQLVAQLRQEGHPVYFGDASRPQVLATVGAANAAAIVVTMDNPEDAERIVAEARRCWPHIPVYARARDAEHARRLHAAGAALASPDAIEAALQLGEALLNGVGVPDEVARRIVDQRREEEVARAIYSAPQ